jgi:hypothetical protein
VDLFGEFPYCNLFDKTYYNINYGFGDDEEQKLLVSPSNYSTKECGAGSISLHCVVAWNMIIE